MATAADIASTRSFAARLGTETMGDRIMAGGTSYSTSGNTPPEVQIDDQTAAPSVWTRLSDVITLLDADGDTITHLALSDGTGIDNWWADGGVVDASGSYVTSNPDGVWFRGDPTASDQTLWVRAYDGTDWGDWESFTLTTAPENGAPVVTVADQTVRPREWAPLAEVLSVEDPEGDAITAYQIRGAGDWWADGALVPAGTAHVTSDLSGVWFKGDRGPSDQTLMVRARDGSDWGDWTEFTLTTMASNALPTVSVPDLALAPLQRMPLAEVISASDPDGDAILRYEFRDPAGGSSWWIDGAPVSATDGCVTKSLSGVTLVAAPSPGTQTLWVRAYDGTEWGDWDSFDLTTVESGAPSVAMPDLTLRGTGGEGYATVNALIDVTDPDGDAVAAIALRDATGLDNVRVDGVGYVDASRGYTVWDPETLIWIDSDMLVDPNASSGSQTIEIRVFDGTEWSDWTAFSVTSLEGGA